jgi:hypothetical protein
MIAVDGSIELPALNGTSIWLDKSLPAPQQAIVKFTVKGQGDFSVGLTQDVVDPQKVPEGYKMVFGAAGNKEVQLRVAGFSKPVAAAQVEGGALNSVVEKGFWIKIAGSKITVGIDDPETGKQLLGWTDPYPPDGIEAVSFSTKEMPATLEQLEIQAIN